MTSQYLQVSYELPSDAKRILSSMKEGPLTITNALAVPVKVYCDRMLQDGSRNARTIGSVSARGVVTLPGLVSGDVLTFTTQGPGGGEYNVGPDYVVNRLHGNITIGATVVAPPSYQSSHRSTSDIHSVVLYNHLPWAIKVFFRGGLVGYIAPNTHRTANSSTWDSSSIARQVPYIHYSNQNLGMNIGETFTFQVDAKGVPEELYSVRLTSADTHDIYIGVVSTTIDSHVRDSRVSYHIGSYNSSGESVVLSHNAKGTDAPRSHGENRVPVARYLPLSGKGVHKNC
jgi:hypothetical protein